jgi:uncharacterized membrane protein YedE/YeeE
VNGRALLGLVGISLGFALSSIGFSSWDEVHAMFTFADLRLFLTFLLGVATLAVAWRLVGKAARRSFTPRPVHPGTLPGGLIFGLGWALCGACPAIALVQLGEGQLGGGFTLAGILAGNWLYAVAHERYFRWSAGSCADI